MIEWALFFVWWFAVIAAAALAVCAGSLLRPSIGGAGIADRALDLIERYLVGLALFSAIAAWVGVLGLLQIWIVWPAALAIAAAGAARVPWGSLLSSVSFPGSLWKNASVSAKAGLLLAVASTALLSLNVAVGALAPDYGQDTVWYHISVPEQWVLDGRLSMYAACVPSTYMLAANVLYVYPLSLGTDVPCSMLNAVSIVIVFALFPLAGWKAGGLRGAVLTALLAPLWALMHGRAPVGAGNDVTTALWLAFGVWFWARPIAQDRAPRSGELALGGFLWGTAISAKILAAGFGLPFAGLLVVWLVRRFGFAKAIQGGLICAGAVLAAMAPWLIRGFVECGNPLMLVSRDLFPVRDEFGPVLAGAAALPNTLYSLTPVGIKTALFDGLPDKITYAGTGLDPLFFLFPAAVVAGLVSKETRWRLLGLGCLGCLVGMVFLHGYNETVRYFGVSYLLALPLFARLMAFAGGALRPGGFVALAGVLAFASFGTFARRQAEWGAYPTVRWGYQPLATEEARLSWVTRTENGYLAETFAAVQPDLPEDALVLLAKSPGPRGLERRALWSDYACPDWEDWYWEALDADGVARSLAEQGVTHLLYHGEGGMDGRVLELEEDGVLTRIPPQDGCTYVLFERMN